MKNLSITELFEIGTNCRTELNRYRGAQLDSKIKFKIENSLTKLIISNPFKNQTIGPIFDE